MKKIKLLTLISAFMFFNCSSYVKIAEAEKIQHRSGLRNGKNYIDYTLKVEAKNNFQFKEININGTTIEKSLYVKNAETGMSSTKIESNYNKGSYIFGFRMFDVLKFNKKETLTFTYTANGKEFNVKKLINKNSVVKSNR